MSAKDDDDREIAQLVRNCWNPATGVHVYGDLLAQLSELCARSFVRVSACAVEGCTVLAEHEHSGPFVMAPTKKRAGADGLELLRSGDDHERAHADIVRQSARCVDPREFCILFDCAEHKRCQFPDRCARLGARDRSVPTPHRGRQHAKRDQSHNLWRVYTFDEKREEVTHARYCEEHEAAQVDAGFWVVP